MGRRKSSARTKSSTPSPVGAPSKKSKTTTLDQIWSQALPTSKTTQQTKPDRRTTNTSPLSSKFASANSFALLSDYNESDQLLAASHLATPPTKSTSRHQTSPRAKTVISSSGTPPGTSKTPKSLAAVPGKSLRLPASKATTPLKPQQQIIELHESSFSSSSSASPDDIRSRSPPSTPTANAASIPAYNLQFVEETPSPLSKSQQQLLATASRRLLFIEDDSDSESNVVQNRFISAPNDSPKAATRQQLGDHTTSPRGNLKNDRDYDTPPSKTIPNMSVARHSSGSTQVELPIEDGPTAAGKREKIVNWSTTTSLKPPPQAAVGEKQSVEPMVLDAPPNTTGASAGFSKSTTTPLNTQGKTQSTSASSRNSAAPPRSTQRCKPPRPLDIRFDVKLPVPPSAAADTALIEVIKKLFTRLKTIDPTIVIYPWYQEHITSAPTLLEPNSTPTSISTLKKYFPRIFPRTAGGDYYTTVRLGLSDPLEHLMDNISWWLQEHKIGLWQRPLQCEETTVLGWLLYSTREMDVKSLAEAIYQSSGLVLGLRWRIITLGKKGAISPELQIRAIHIEANSADTVAAKTWIKRTYGSQSTGPFPNGIRMRLVPELTPLTNTYTRVKIDRLRARQSAFTKGVLRATTWELHSLDYASKETGTTLRDLIMGIRAKEKPELLLFHSVDDHWQGNGHVVTFLPSFQSEARMILSCLLTYLQFYHPDKAADIATYFTEPAVERAEEAKWDPVRYCVITPDDEMIDDLLEADTDFDLPDDTADSRTAAAIADSTSGSTRTSRPEADNLSRTLYGRDEDSVSTMATNRTGRKKVTFKSTEPTTVASTQQSSITSMQDGQGSTVSSISQTIEDRFASMELLVHTNINETSQLLRKILEKQEAFERTSNPPHQGHPAGQPVVTPTGEAGIPRDAGSGP